MSYTMYTPLNVWLDPASVTDVVAYIQTYLSENTIYSETEIETIIHDYLIAHPELIGGVQSVNGKTGTVVLSASDINTENNVTIESVLASLSSQISSIAASVATNTANITNLTGRVTTAETDISNLKSSIDIFAATGVLYLSAIFVYGSPTQISDTDAITSIVSVNRIYNAKPIVTSGAESYTVSDGYSVYVWRKQSNGAWVGDGWKTGTFSVSGIYGLVFVIRRGAEANSTSAADAIAHSVLYSALTQNTYLLGEVNANKEEIIKNSQDIDKYSHDVRLSSSDFELGAITISTDGWAYYSSRSRLRTKEGVTIPLKAGYVVALTDYSDARFYLGWFRANGTYGLAGWNTSDYVLTEDGDYVVLIVNRTETAQTSIDALFNLLRIYKKNTDTSLSEYNAPADAQITGDMLNATSPNSMMTIGHGATTSYPSNVLETFRKFYKSGILAWESDVRPCLDGYVMCHDNDIYNHALDANNQTIPQGSVLISDSTIADLKTYKFGVITNQQNNGIVQGFENATIPTLREFLMCAKALGVRPWIEIKFSPTQTQMNEVVDIIKQCGMLDHAYILAYDSVSTVVPLACQRGIKRIAMIIDNGSASDAAIDTAYSYISQYIDGMEDVIFLCGYSNYSEDVCDYAAAKGMRSGVFTISANPTSASVIGYFGDGASAMITNKDNLNAIIRKSQLT